MTYLSVVIPAYNEIKNFKNGVLSDVHKYFSNKNYTYEIIIVDDESSDGSPELIEKFCRNHNNFKFFKNPHMGKSGTVAKGVSLANGNYILFTDFDQATPISEWEKLIPYLEKGYDFVIGSREIEGSKREKEPWYRHVMGRGFNFGVRLLAVGGISDTQCGFKAFNSKVAKKLFQKLQVYKPKKISSAFTGAFDVELIFLARKFNYKIAEVPIVWKHVETDRVNPIKDSFLMAIDVIKIRIFNILGKYE